MIALSEIRHGDEVSLVDPDGNKVTGVVNFDARTDTLWLRAFSLRIAFARHNAAGWHRIGGIDVVWHQSDLFANP
jgi:hypothetical protein